MGIKEPGESGTQWNQVRNPDLNAGVNQGSRGNRESAESGEEYESKDLKCRGESRNQGNQRISGIRRGP